MKPVFQRTGGSAADRNYFRQVGLDRWYGGGVVYTINFTTTTVTANQMYAIPFLESRGGTLDRIGFYCTAGGPHNFRLGIYESTSRTVIYPGALVLDAGVVASAAATLCSAVINQALTAETLYFLTLLPETTGGTTFRANQQAYCWSCHGNGSGAGFYPGGPYVYAAQAYGALPANYPAGGTVPSADCPMVAVRYSA